MAAKRSVIDDEQIIALYRSGYSQNDIVRNYQVSVQRTRSVLQNANFDTRSFRALDETMESVIQSLVRNGIVYLDIERATNISFHAIRQYVTERWKPSSEERITLPGDAKRPTLQEFPLRDKILKAYGEGVSFCLLVKQYGLDADGILCFYLSLTDRRINQHHEAFRAHILEDHASGMSFSTLARKNCVSRAVIKKYMTNT